MAVGSTVVLVPVAVCIILLGNAIYHRFSNPLRSFPGPEVTRWTDLVAKSHFLIGNRPRYIESLHKQYGPIVRVGPNELAINDVAATKEIHKVGGRYLKSGFYTHIGHKSAKTLFSTTDPKHHAVRRRLLSGPMSDASLKRFEPIIMQRVRLCIAQMSSELENRQCMDIFKWWTFLATDVIGELSFGQSFQMLEHGKPSQYSKDLESIASLMAIRTTFPFLSNVSQWVPIPTFKRAAASGERMARYAQQSVDRYKNIVAQNVEPKPMLFSKVMDKKEDGLTDAEIRLEAGGYIVAGSDTTALTLTYLVWAVCHDINIRDKLVAEVTSLPDGFTDDDTRGLSFLNQVIDETLRLFPAAPGSLPRAVPAGGADLVGHYVPAGTTVSTQAYSLHRDPSVFPDPHKFSPERWAAPTQEMKSTFMPFGGGTRVCIGMHLARAEMRLATAYFFRTFPRAKVSAKENMVDDDMEPLMFFLVSPKGHRCLIDSEV